jgi:subtilisin family serine protease
VYHVRGTPRGIGAAEHRPGAPNDPLFRLEPAAGAWHLADLHRIATGRGITIAIVDSKIETTHPDLVGQFITDQDFVGTASMPRYPGIGEYHGTGIAGVIAAREGNGMGIAGIAPAARLMALRACWQTGPGQTLCNSLSLARALQFAIDHDAKIINLSLSGPPDTLLEKLVGIAITRHETVVAAFDPALPSGGFPASLPGVIAVTDESLPSWPIGVYGAPGRDVPTTQPGGKWYLVNGSSYAAAHVSGLVALVRQERKSLPVTLNRDASGGIDACATLLRTTVACACACAVDYQMAARH